MRETADPQPEGATLRRWRGPCQVGGLVVGPSPNAQRRLPFRRDSCIAGSVEDVLMPREVLDRPGVGFLVRGVVAGVMAVHVRINRHF